MALGLVAWVMGSEGWDYEVGLKKRRRIIYSYFLFFPFSCDENLLRFTLLATFKYTMHITRYSHHDIYYAYMTYLFYNWRFVFFNLLQPFHILPLSLPLVTTHLFFVLISSFSFLVPAFFSDATYKWDHTLSVFLCLTYFTSQKAFKVHLCCCTWQDFFLFYSQIVLYHIYIYMYTHTHTHHTFFIPSVINGYLGCSHILAIVNNAPNLGVHVSFWVSVFISFQYISRSGTAGSHGSSVFSFWRTSILSSIVTAPVYTLTNGVQVFPFFHILASTCYLFFLMISILIGMRWQFIVVLICISLVIHDIEHLFMDPLVICMSSLGKCPLHIFKLDFFVLELQEMPMYFGSFANMFFYSVGCFFTLLMGLFHCGEAF